MNLTIQILLAIAAMLMLAFGLVGFVVMYQRRVLAHQMELKKINELKELELTQASIRSEEKEKMRIASELHDDVGATLASVRLFLYKDKDADFDADAIQLSKDLLDQSIEKIRNISHKLQPATLQHLGLELSLQALLETLDKSGNIAARHIVRQKLPRASDNAEMAAYRIIQELIANMLKHAGATEVTLETDADAHNIIIIFTHDGTGLTQEEYEQQIFKKGATGLKNILNRLKSVGASLSFYKEDEYYKTLLIVPLDFQLK